ncbi:hypothetical protein K435DRAFT_891198 [Dendrothele bispora CBS 962.96]|uniref:Uncharacterized protein n=1 Tax=Dendrothele bispora (strain CBS 962.96) TaxID=1314807 RepID=A0A4V4HFZ6_DENBC|nr:hypothetical protein K435DRAFT_891198 [Dendrothele bispora CBS 962.96]
MSQQCLDQYSNMSTQDVVQHFRTYSDQWSTSSEGADSLNRERRVLYANNNYSQTLVVLTIVLAYRINDVPDVEAQQYSILDAARRVLSSYGDREYRGSPVPPGVESFLEESLSHDSTVSDFFYAYYSRTNFNTTLSNPNLNLPSQISLQQQQQPTTQNQLANYDPNPIPPFPSQNPNQNHPPSSTTESQSHSPDTGYHTTSPRTSLSSTLLNPSCSNSVKSSPRTSLSSTLLNPSRSNSVKSSPRTSLFSSLLNPSRSSSVKSQGEGEGRGMALPTPPPSPPSGNGRSSGSGSSSRHGSGGQRSGSTTSTTSRNGARIDGNMGSNYSNRNSTSTLGTRANNAGDPSEKMTLHFNPILMIIIHCNISIKLESSHLILPQL